MLCCAGKDALLHGSFDLKLNSGRASGKHLSEDQLTDWLVAVTARGQTGLQRCV